MKTTILAAALLMVACGSTEIPLVHDLYSIRGTDVECSGAEVVGKPRPPYLALYCTWTDVRLNGHVAARVRVDFIRDTFKSEWRLSGVHEFPIP